MKGICSLSFLSFSHTHTLFTFYFLPCFYSFSSIFVISSLLTMRPTAPLWWIRCLVIVVHANWALESSLKKQRTLQRPVTDRRNAVYGHFFRPVSKVHARALYRKYMRRKQELTWHCITMTKGSTRASSWLFASVVETFRDNITTTVQLCELGTRLQAKWFFLYAFDYATLVPICTVFGFVCTSKGCKLWRVKKSIKHIIYWSKVEPLRKREIYIGRRRLSHVCHLRF